MLTKSDAGQRLGCRRGVALALTCFGVAAGIRAYKPFQPQGGGKEMAEATSRATKADEGPDKMNGSGSNLTPCSRCATEYSDCGANPCEDAAGCGVCGSSPSDPGACEPDPVSLLYPCEMDEVMGLPDCEMCAEKFGEGPGDCGGAPCDDACACGVCGSYGSCGSSCKADPAKGRHGCNRRDVVEENAPGVGTWSGTCTCTASGNTYWVGDIDGDSLACYNGIAGPVLHGNNQGSGVRVACASAWPRPPPTPPRPPPPPPPSHPIAPAGPSPPQYPPGESDLVEEGLKVVGTWSGTCTCPNGAVYWVGDHFHGGEELACINGVAGLVDPASRRGAGRRVTCHIRPPPPSYPPLPPQPPAPPPPPQYPPDIFDLVEENVPDVGTWSGTCSCPNGAVYWVGDYFDESTLACFNGIAGEVVEGETRGAGRRVTCHIPNGGNPSGDSSGEEDESYSVAFSFKTADECDDTFTVTVCASANSLPAPLPSRCDVSCIGAARRRLEEHTVSVTLQAGDESSAISIAAALANALGETAPEAAAFLGVSVSESPAETGGLPSISHRPTAPPDGPAKPLGGAKTSTGQTDPFGLGVDITLLVVSIVLLVISVLLAVLIVRQRQSQRQAPGGPPTTDTAHTDRLTRTLANKGPMRIMDDEEPAAAEVYRASL